MSALPARFAAWFARQRLDAARAPARGAGRRRRPGERVLLIAPTGGGKTLAGFLPSLVDLAAAPRAGLHTLYVSPLKALAADIARNLMRPVAEMALPITHRDAHRRHAAAERRRQREAPPNILLTTPESLALLLSLPGRAGDVRRRSPPS